MVEISIIVPAYNARHTIRRCINSLLVQDIESNYEIIVSDDGSTDDTPQVLAGYENEERVVPCRHENVKLAENRNIGARAANGEILIFLDADMIAASTLISSHVNKIKDLDEKGIILGSVPVAEESCRFPLGRYLSEKWERRLLALANDTDNVLLMQGGNFSIQKGFYRQLGGFDSSFDRYGGEDIDFFARAKKSGAIFAYEEEAKSFHLVDTSFRSLYRKAKSIPQSKMKLEELHPDLFWGTKKENRMQTPSLMNRIWTYWRKFPPSNRILLLLLPIIEKKFSDRHIFIIYNSLLSSAKIG